MSDLLSPDNISYEREFKDAIKEIIYTSARLESPFDRVRTMDWMKKLNNSPCDTLDKLRIRNEYVQYLRIILNSEPVCFFRPFKESPPKTELVTLSEVLGNFIAADCPYLPRTGPIHPVMSHKSDDGKTFMTIKRCPEGGVFCYMAITPDSLRSFK